MKVYKKFLGILTVFLLIGLGVSAVKIDLESTDLSSFNSRSTVLKEADIVIPDDFTTIQEGIDNSQPGYTVFVKKGIYEENIRINKTGLSLIGENKYNTIIDGGYGSSQGIIIDASDVVVKNFTIRYYKDASRDDIFSWNQAGVEVKKPNVTILNNRFIDNGVGVELFSKAFNATIKNNFMINDGFLIGNYLDMEGFPNITKKSFLHNIENNTVNGKPVYYFENKKDFSVPSDAGQITCVNCSNFTIEDLFLSNNDFSIILAYCYNSVIRNNTVEDTNGEILLFKCENSTVSNNLIRNTFKGICLELGSKNNIVKNNELSNNYVGVSLYSEGVNNTIYKNKIYGNSGPMAAGVEVVSYIGGCHKFNNISENIIYDNPIGIHFSGDCVNNSVYKNQLFKNLIGIYLQQSSDYNKIVGNVFFKNFVKAFFFRCSTNIWDFNDWGRHRILPKLIFGFKEFERIVIPWFNVDLRPFDYVDM